MAETAAAIGAYIALVGPATEAITQIINLGTSIGWVTGDENKGGVNNVINIGVGFYESGDQDDFGGDPLVVSGYTGQGTYIGTGHMGGYMSQGQASSTVLDLTGLGDDVQAMSLMIQEGGSDAVCIAYIELAWMGNLFSGMTGDFGEMCEQDWYYSSATWGFNPDGTPYTPNCMWVDGGSAKMHPLEEFSVNMEYLLASGDTIIPGDANSTATYCNTAFSFAAETTDNHNSAVPNGLGGGAGVGSGPERLRRRSRIQGNNNKYETEPVYPAHNSTNGSPTCTASGTASTGTASVPQSTGTLRTHHGFSSRLVISSKDKHSATHLCESKRSRGPDLVSLSEGVYCDMANRRTYPLCSDKVAIDCFSYDEGAKKVYRRDGSGLGKRGVKGGSDALHREYKSVDVWDA